jgi:Tol biopolymer transport system component
MKSRNLLIVMLASLMGGCAAPSLVSIPFDPGGRGLNSPYAEMNPRITGRYIVVASDRRGSQDIYLYDTNARNLIELPGLNSLDMVATNPAVSENGRFIAFGGNRQGRSAIYVYDRDTRQLRNLTENLKTAVRNPSITADGNAIAFEASINGQWDILLYNRFGQPINGLPNSQR